MRKIYLTFLVMLAMGTFVFGQRVHEGAQPVNSPALQMGMNKTTVIDTIFPESFTTLPCAANLVLYNSGAGYVCGNNNYGDVAKAQKFYLGGGATGSVMEALVFFGGKFVTDSNATLVSQIHESMGATGPGALIQASNTITMGDVDTTGGFTSFMFPTPAAVNDSFFLNIVLPTTAGDTVGIVSTQDPCTTGDLLWEEWAGGYGWFSFQDANGWDLAIDMLVSPVVDVIAVGMEDAYLQSPRGLKLFAVSPNPAVNNTTVRMEMEGSSSVIMNVIDLNGRIIDNVNYGTLAGGRHDLALNVDKYAAGTYYVMLYTDFGHLAAKVNVAK